MDSLASQVAESDDISATEEALRERWDGAPHKIAEDLFRTRNMETGVMEDLRLFYPYQPKILSAYFYGKESIKNVYKGRRIGVSFIICVAMTIDGLAHDNTNYAIVSTKIDQSQERLKDIRTLLSNSRVVGDQSIENWLTTDNKNELELPNGSVYRAFTGNPDGARGMDSARTVMVDEMAFLDDQKATMQAFMPFISLGSHRQMWQISTPKMSNDLFLETNERGSPTGHDGVISIKQPSFKNPESIDIYKSLIEQDVEPVRPDMDVTTVESERAQDPQGFAQEYLCRPISDEYRFFSGEAIERAVQRGAREMTPNGPTGRYSGYSPMTHARKGGKMIMGVDIGIDRDDTAIAVFEHTSDHRYLRFHTCLDEGDLHAVGIRGDPNNPSDMALYVTKLADNMGVDKVFVDKTGPGTGYMKEINRRLGRRAQQFNFSDKTEIERMMGDMNYALYNDALTLVPDDVISGQLKSIVKEQRHETSKPRFTGKKYAPEGKDDMAMALVLGAFPPNFDAGREDTLHIRENVSEYQPDDGPQYADGEVDPERDLGAFFDAHTDSNGAKRGQNSVFGRAKLTGEKAGGRRVERRYEVRNKR